MKLLQLMVDTKSAWIDFPGAPGFSIEVVNLSRKELVSLRKRCISQKFDRKTRQINEVLDEDKFIIEFAAATIKGWKGLKLAYLEDLILVDLKEHNPEDELEYDKEQAETLIQNSTEFDNWVNEVVFDLANFRGNGSRKSDGKSGVMAV